MKKFNLKKGFTLIEALVAVSILMVAVAAPITIAQKGLSSAGYSKDQMIASYLAQDAIEYIINQRDQASINSTAFKWDTFLDVVDHCLYGKSCEIDTVEISFGNGTHVQPYNGTYIRKIENASGEFEFYGYNPSGEDTKFTRNIMIDLNDDGYEALVTVTVSWPGGNSVVVNTLIYNY